jgi:hypothetical protein
MEKKELLAVSLIAIVLSAVTSIGTLSLAPKPTPEATPMEVRNVYTEGFSIARQRSPVDSYPYGYRLCMENYSIVTVGATSNNASEQSASITSSVNRETTHIILLVTFQSHTAGQAVAVWTKASKAGKVHVLGQVTDQNVTQQIILPYSYSTDGKVYWQMTKADAATIVTIYLWGYFERGIGTVK